MARLAYYAPGVYVEEIPSARQPIAGVGTNTVGFIGLVPREIHCPVANPDYDPVLARTLLDYQRLTADKQKADEQRMRLEAALRSLGEEVERLSTAVETAQKDRDAVQKNLDDASRALDAAGDDDKAKTAALNRAQKAQKDLVKAEKKLEDTTIERDAKKGQRDDLEHQKELAEGPGAVPAAPPGGAAPAAPPGGAAPPAGAPHAKVEEEDPDYKYELTDRDKTLLVKSKVRPYSLEKITVKAAELDTKLCTNFTEYTDRFGDFSAFRADPENPDADDPSAWRFRPMYPGHHLLTHAVDGFFKNGGTRCFVARISDLGKLADVL